jgi:hypothetical protein
MQERPSWAPQSSGGALTVDRSVDRLTVDRSVDRWVDRLTVDRQTVDRSVDRWVTRLTVDRWVDRLAVDRQTVDRSVDRLTVDRQTVERWVFNPQTPKGRQLGTGASCSRQFESEAVQLGCITPTVRSVKARRPNWEGQNGDNVAKEARAEKCVAWTSRVGSHVRSDSSRMRGCPPTKPRRPRPMGLFFTEVSGGAPRVSRLRKQ